MKSAYTASDAASQNDFDIFAKLLASEDIDIVHGLFRTASFNLHTREMRLPMWSNMTKEARILLRAHEVAHALYTPEEGTHEAIERIHRGKQRSYFHYLNIVEDARIERLIQRSYPGLKSYFTQGYRDLISIGIFGEPAKVAKLCQDGLLIDRLNLKAKIGQEVDVKISGPVECRFWLRLTSTTEFSEVVELANDLYEYAKANKEESKAPETDDQEMMSRSENGNSERAEDEDQDSETEEVSNDEVENENDENDEVENDEVENDEVENDEPPESDAAGDDSDDSDNDDDPDESDDGTDGDDDITPYTESNYRENEEELTSGDEEDTTRTYNMSDESAAIVFDFY